MKILKYIIKLIDFERSESSILRCFKEDDTCRLNKSDMKQIRGGEGGDEDLILEWD